MPSRLGLVACHVRPIPSRIEPAITRRRVGLAPAYPRRTRTGGGLHRAVPERPARARRRAGARTGGPVGTKVAQRASTSYRPLAPRRHRSRPPRRQEHLTTAGRERGSRVSLWYFTPSRRVYIIRNLQELVDLFGRAAVAVRKEVAAVSQEVDPVAHASVVHV